MYTYLNLLKKVKDKGEDTLGRNGLVRSLFGEQVTYSLQEGFPIITTKKMAFNAIKGELLAFINGAIHVKDFQKLGCNVWNKNAEDWDKEGYLGRIYGAQWRNWKSVNPETGEIIVVDQLLDTIKNIKEDPFSRRHIISAWNPGELKFQSLPACHTLMQFHVLRDENNIKKPKYLSLKMYQRSADIFLGVAFNISSYCLFLSMIAQITNLEPLYFIHSLGDVHLYEQHFEAADEQLQNKPLLLPKLQLNADIQYITDFEPKDIKLIGYKSYSKIKAEMIV